LGKTGIIPIVFFFLFFAAIYFADDGVWFFGIIVILVFGSFILQAVSAFWTFYAITTKRVIILHPSMFSTIIESYYPPDIDFLKNRRKSDGSGNIIFAAVREKKRKRTETVEIGFYGVDDVDAVEAMILQLREPTSRNSPPFTPHRETSDQG